MNEIGGNRRKVIINKVYNRIEKADLNMSYARILINDRS